jgi:hypothetical protein
MMAFDCLVLTPPFTTYAVATIWLHPATKRRFAKAQAVVVPGDDPLATEEIIALATSRTRKDWAKYCQEPAGPPDGWEIDSWNYVTLVSQ